MPWNRAYKSRAVCWASQASAATGGSCGGQLRRAAADGHAGAQLAVAVFLHQLGAGIGAMAASLGGVEQIALSGGIGAHDPQLLAELQRSMGWLGPVAWRQIAADEEGMIARLVSRADPAFGAAAG